MNFLQSFHLAMKGLISNKLRSFLTMLGLIIGVSSVILLTSLMNGVSGKVVETFSELGSDKLSIYVGNFGARHVKEQDAYTLVKENNTIFKGVIPSVSFDTTLKYKDKVMVQTTVTGTGESFIDFSKGNLSNGRFISYIDVKNRYKVCVLGTYYAEELFGTTDVLDKSIWLNGDLYDIIGVLEKTSNSTLGSTDECIYIPYSVALRDTNQLYPTTYDFYTYSAEQVTNGEKILDAFLYDIYKDESLYYISNINMVLDAFQSIMKIISSVLSGIAAISLVVAGIGIMNIMLVSVVERTREIGIRKALGAKKSDIKKQFIIEASTISSFGGILGILFGILLAKLIGPLFKINATPSIFSILLSFFVSVSIGIFFGYMPAKRAAKLNPIDALRNE